MSLSLSRPPRRGEEKQRRAGGEGGGGGGGGGTLRRRCDPCGPSRRKSRGEVAPRDNTHTHMLAIDFKALMRKERARMRGRADPAGGSGGSVRAGGGGGGKLDASRHGVRGFGFGGKAAGTLLGILCA